MGQRMTAQEFGEWKTFFDHEQLHPGADRMRHAVLVAAVHNGPLVRKDKELWSAAHVLPPPPWSRAQDAAAPTARQIAAQVDQINALMQEQQHDL